MTLLKAAKDPPISHSDKLSLSWPLRTREIKPRGKKLRHVSASFSSCSLQALTCGQATSLPRQQPAMSLTNRGASAWNNPCVQGHRAPAEVHTEPCAPQGPNRPGPGPSATPAQAARVCGEARPQARPVAPCQHRANWGAGSSTASVCIPPVLSSDPDYSV